MTHRIIQGDVLECLREMQGASVQCVVTSPPYWGLRDYGVEGQIGLEATPAEFIEKMVAVFREVRRVLRSDGTCWVNMGDSYATGTTSDRNATATGKHGYWENPAVNKRIDGRSIGLKPKDLIGMPWRLAFALQADGWWLRQDIIWSKPNPMPESVTDRCTKAHEYIFLLTKSARYFYDAETVLEECSPNTHARLSQDVQSQIGSDRAHAGGKTNGNMKAVGRKLAAKGSGTKNNESFDSAMAIMPRYRNKRSVWEIATEAFSEAHFATFPTKLVEPCVLAGTRPGDVVMDPFSGAATTGMVALRLGREYIGIELNPEYVAMSERRLATYWRSPQRQAKSPEREHAPLFAGGAV